MQIKPTTIQCGYFETWIYFWIDISNANANCRFYQYNNASNLNLLLTDTKYLLYLLREWEKYYTSYQSIFETKKNSRFYFHFQIICNRKTKHFPHLKKLLIAKTQFRQKSYFHPISPNAFQISENCAKIIRIHPKPTDHDYRSQNDTRCIKMRLSVQIIRRILTKSPNPMSGDLLSG